MSGIPNGLFGVIARKNGGSTFVPTDVSGLVGWFKADAGVLEAASDPAEDGDSVVTWEDQSTSGLDQTVTNTIYRSSRSGMPALELTSATAHFTQTLPFTGTNHSLFMVLETTDQTFYLYGDGSGATDYVGRTNPSSTSAHTPGNQKNAGSLTYVDGTVLAAETRVALNDAIQAGQTNAIISSIDFKVGGLSPFEILGHTFSASGWIREVLFYDNAVGSTDQASIEAYLERWP